MKVAVIGYSGAGKSTMAKRLGRIYHCPVLYLDTVNFEAGWKQRDWEECKAIVKKFMEQEDSWVIDGNFSDFYHGERMQTADRIIFMDFSRRVCLRQALRRFFKFRNRARESRARGCAEKFDLEFLRWILVDGRSREEKAKYNEICRRYRDKVVICRNCGDVKRCIKQKVLSQRGS